MDGLEFLERKKKSNSYCPIIMISGHGNIETAVQALKKEHMIILRNHLTEQSTSCR